MLLNNDRTRVLHMVEYAQHAINFLEDRVPQDLEEDLKLRLAVVYALEIFGEAASRVSQQTRNAHPEVPWQLAISMRNKLAHAYFEVDQDVVWRTIREYLPPLIPLLQKIVDELSPCGGNTDA